MLYFTHNNFSLARHPICTISPRQKGFMFIFIWSICLERSIEDVFFVNLFITFNKSMHHKVQIDIFIWVHSLFAPYCTWSALPSSGCHCTAKKIYATGANLGLNCQTKTNRTPCNCRVDKFTVYWTMLTYDLFLIIGRLGGAGSPLSPKDSSPNSPMSSFDAPVMFSMSSSDVGGWPSPSVSTKYFAGAFCTSIKHQT